MAKAPALTLVPTSLASTSGSITFDRGIGKIQWNRPVVAGTEVLQIYTTNAPIRTTTLATINYSDAAAHYTYTTKIGTTTAARTLNFGWFISSSASVDSYVRFSGLLANSYITISFDIKGYIISNLTIVLGETEYTWDLIYEPIIILSDKDSAWTGDDPTQVILSEGLDEETGEYWSKWYHNTHTGLWIAWKISTYSSQTYVLNQAIRYADLTNETSTG